MHLAACESMHIYAHMITHAECVLDMTFSCSKFELQFDLLAQMLAKKLLQSIAVIAASDCNFQNHTLQRTFGLLLLNSHHDSYNLIRKIFHLFKK